MQALEKEIKEKENELNSLKLEIKSKVSLLGYLDQLVNRVMLIMLAELYQNKGK